jgi:hypothetical protein
MAGFVQKVRGKKIDPEYCYVSKFNIYFSIRGLDDRKMLKDLSHATKHGNPREHRSLDVPFFMMTYQ